MNLDYDDKLERLQKVMDELPETDRLILLYDIQNAYEDRNTLLINEYGLDKKRNREYYVQALKKRVRQLVEGTYKPRKTKFDKFKN